MGGQISLADLKAQTTPKSLPLRDKLVVPPEMRDVSSTSEAKPAGETYGLTKKTISLEQLKRQVEGVKPEHLKENLTV